MIRFKTVPLVATLIEKEEWYIKYAFDVPKGASRVIINPIFNPKYTVRLENFGAKIFDGKTDVLYYTMDRSTPRTDQEYPKVGDTIATATLVSETPVRSQSPKSKRSPKK